MSGYEWWGRACFVPNNDAELDEPLPERPRRTPANRNGMPGLVLYVWRRGETERAAEVDAKVLELRALAVSRMAANDTGSGVNGHEV